ncbi:MAG: anaerobic ribonucleoside-triphosphate reductase [Candidatus Fermentibacter sp.]|nr:anaerobic ribonucleoside-triphosphate reductase [Candidatus Fermentibacter sp.]
MTEEEKGDSRIKAVKAEVYSRVVGYYRPVQDWNRGKQAEFADRTYVDITPPPEGKGEPAV